MSEAEFDRVMDAVRRAIAPSDFIEPPRAANDNEGVWPSFHFPSMTILLNPRQLQSLVMSIFLSCFLVALHKLKSERFSSQFDQRSWDL
jgi:hypothetical protein